MFIIYSDVKDEVRVRLGLALEGSTCGMFSFGLEYVSAVEVLLIRGSTCVRGPDCNFHFLCSSIGCVLAREFLSNPLMISVNISL